MADHLLHFPVLASNINRLPFSHPASRRDLRLWSTLHIPSAFILKPFLCNPSRASSENKGDCTKSLKEKKEASFQRREDSPPQRPCLPLPSDPSLPCGRVLFSRLTDVDQGVGERQDFTSATQKGGKEDPTLLKSHQGINMSATGGGQPRGGSVCGLRNCTKGTESNNQL